MSVNISFHAYWNGTPRISAFSVRTAGAPLQIKVGSGVDRGHGDITIYTGNQAYTDALIAAINAVPFPSEAAPIVERIGEGLAEA